MRGARGSIVLGDAVRFVHRKEHKPAPLLQPFEPVDHPTRQQLLRRHVNEGEVSLQRALLHGGVSLCRAEESSYLLLPAANGVVEFCNLMRGRV